MTSTRRLLGRTRTVAVSATAAAAVLTGGLVAGVAHYSAQATGTSGTGATTSNSQSSQNPTSGSSGLGSANQTAPAVAGTHGS